MEIYLTFCIYTRCFFNVKEEVRIPRAHVSREQIIKKLKCVHDLKNGRRIAFIL